MGWCWKAQPSDEPPLGLSPHDDSWGCQLFLCLFLGQCNPGSGVWSHRSQDTDGTRGVEPPTSRFCPWSVASVQWFAAISWVPAAPVSPNWPCWSWGSAGTNPGATTHPKSGAHLWLRSQMGPRHGHTILLPHLISPPLTQVLQLRRAGPPRQGVQAPSAAQEVPLLPEHQPHGGQLPRESTAVAQLAGKARLLPRGGGHAQLGPPPRIPGMMVGGRERGFPPG